MIFQKINEFVKLPEKMYKGDAGYDFYLPNQITIEANQTKTIALGFSIKLHKNECAMIVLRSSIASQGLIANTCLIDSGYTGEVHLVLHNISKYGKCFQKFCRIGSVVILKIRKDRRHLLSNRNDNSFGSSGK